MKLQAFGNQTGQDPLGDVDALQPLAPVAPIDRIIPPNLSAQSAAVHKHRMLRAERNQQIHSASSEGAVDHIGPVVVQEPKPGFAKFIAVKVC